MLRGDLNKFVFGMLYYVKEFEEDVFDVVKEVKDVLVVGGGRLSTVGCDSSAAKFGLENGVKYV